MLEHGRRCGWWGGGMGDCEDRGGGGGARRGAKRQVGVVVLVRDVKPHVYLEYVFTPVALNRCLAGTGGVRSVAFGPTYAYVYVFVWDKCVRAIKLKQW
jgi:hypothetical protein